MPRTLEALEAEALELPDQARAKLAKSLLLSLEGMAEAGTEEEWARLAEERYQEIKEGRVRAIPTEQVFSEARARLR